MTNTSSLSPVMNPFEIHTAPGGAAAEIESRLLESLHAQQPQAHNSTFSLQADDCDQRLIGGLTAATSYGWLLIKTLWVHPDQRGSGVGRALVLAAEDRARQCDCHGAWLDTSSAAAREFYLRCGYVEFGVLANRPTQHPAQHRRWFMQKQWINA
ncbi:MAG: GNAT family N-acetyltransferase [Pseudomonadota bacterium]